MKRCTFYRMEDNQLAGGRPILTCFDSQLQCQRYEREKHNKLLEKSRLRNQTITKTLSQKPNVHDPKRNSQKKAHENSTQTTTTVESALIPTRPYESAASTATFGFAQAYLGFKILFLALTIFSFSVCKVFKNCSFQGFS